MVSDLRRTFIGWLKKTESELKREKQKLIQSRRDLEAMKQREAAELERIKRQQIDKLAEERRSAHAELTTSTKQLAIERDEARRRINEDRSKFEHEKELSRRRILMEREKFRQEYAVFQNERRRVVDVSIATESMADVNVGGVIFQSSRHTLVQQPGSLLEALFSGRHKMPRDREGRIFVDRDGELFRIILNFLRDPSTHPLPRDAAESDAILKESAFYGINFFPFPLVFACGGHNGVEHLRAVEVLDVNEQCWRPCRAMETERTYFGSGVMSGRLYVFGGQNLDYKALCDVECYDALRDCWTAAPPLNVSRRNTAGATLNDDRLFAIGGFDGASILTSVEAYDPRMRSWTLVASLNTARSSAAVAVYGGALYVFGGTRGERLKTVEVYDQRMDKWQPLDKDMLEVRSAACACGISDNVYILGGTDAEHKVHSSVEVYSGATNAWSFVRNMKQQRMDASCIPVAESILVAGGQAGAVLQSTEFYRPDLDEWQTGPEMIFPRYGHELIIASI
eukprot:Lankesteria_metandrocarpae@DN4266_c0_g1_i10.p1